MEKLSAAWSYIKLKLLCTKWLRVKGICTVSRRAKVFSVNGKIEFEKGVQLRDYVRVSAVHGGKVSLGKHVCLNQGVIIVSRGTVEIENDCAIAPNVAIYDHDHLFDMNGVIQNKYKVGSVYIGKNCWIGANAVILRDTSIGEGCVIGAGTVVKGYIPPHSLVTADRALKIVPIENRTIDAATK